MVDFIVGLDSCLMLAVLGVVDAVRRRRGLGLVRQLCRRCWSGHDEEDEGYSKRKGEGRIKWVFYCHSQRRGEREVLAHVRLKQPVGVKGLLILALHSSTLPGLYHTQRR